MADEAGSFERLAEQLAVAVEPVAGMLSDEEVLDTLASLGVLFPEGLLDDPTITASRLTVIGAAEALDPLVTELADAIEAGDTGRMVLTGAMVVGQAVALVDSFDSLVDALQTTGPTLPGIDPAQVTELVTDLPQKLVDLLVVRVLELQPVVAAIATVLGVIERTYHPGDPDDETRPDFDHVRSVWTGCCLPSPTPSGTSPTSTCGARPGSTRKRCSSRWRRRWPGWASPAAAPGRRCRADGAGGLRRRCAPSAPGPGLRVDVVLPGSLDRTFTFPVSPPTWNAEVTTRGTLVAGASAEVGPPFELEVSTPTVDVDGEVTVSIVAEPEESFVVLGEAGGTRLEFQRFELGGGLAFGASTSAGGSAIPTVTGGISGGRLVVDASQGDGFLTTILGGGRVESSFDVGFSFAPDTGLRFDGSGSLEIQVPVHVEIGPVEVSAIYLVGRVEGVTVPLELSAALGANLGVAPGQRRPAGGDRRLSASPTAAATSARSTRRSAFKPPNGVGLSLDAGVVKGGGYLFFDFDRGEYAGALELDVRRVPHPQGDRPHHHPDARRLEGLLAADHHHRGVRHRHPARLRLHAARRRRAARASTAR